MYSLVRKCLFQLDPERAHHFTLSSLKFAHQLGLLKLLPKVASQPVTVMGLTFKNRIGLAAGFDLNADYIMPLAELGFGFIEVGGVTPKPQEGNPKPRIFRLQQENAIINRMGFHNKGVDYLAKQLEHANHAGIIGVNITKNRSTPNEEAIEDYLYCFRQLQKSASYITINVSSPNTPGLRHLQQSDYLKPLLSALKKEQAAAFQRNGKYIPLVVKISPDLSIAELNDAAAILLEEKIDGVVATNTTLSRDGVENSPHKNEAGGLSGMPLRTRSTQMVRTLASILQGRLPIIALGGIMDEESAREKLDAGASLLQIYTGLIYQGPGLVKRLASI